MSVDPELRKKVKKNRAYSYLKKSSESRPNLFSFLVLCVVVTSFVLGSWFASYCIKYADIPPKEVGYVVAAIIAGFVGILVSETSKESEIGKHREKWIELLKDEVSLFSVKVLKFAYKAFSLTKENSPDEVCLKSEGVLGEDVLQIRESYHKIALFVKCADKEKNEWVVYQQCRSVLKTVEGFVINADKFEEEGGVELMDEWSDKMKGLNYSSRKVVYLVKEYVDGEWDDIKKGHFDFRCRRAVLLSLLFFVVGFFITYSYLYYEGAKVPVWV